MAIAALAGWWMVLSVFMASSMFGADHGSLTDFRRGLSRLRVVNNYHLFGHITRDRIEPLVQVRQGISWRTLYMHYKPTDPREAPRFAWPHQPRLDFRLWFYGVDVSRQLERGVPARDLGAPEYVRRLVWNVCHDPQAVQPFFTNLIGEPEEIRIAFERFHFTTPEQRAETGDWFRQARQGTGMFLTCPR